MLYEVITVYVHTPDFAMFRFYTVDSFYRIEHILQAFFRIRFSGNEQNTFVSLFDQYFHSYNFV